MVLHLSRIFYPNFIKIWVKRINGVDNIPLKDPFVFCANHSSFLDDVFVPTIIGLHTRRYFHFYVNSRFYKSRLLKRFLDHFQCIPVYVEKYNYSRRKNEEAFKVALAYLKKGDSVGMFPEGRRSKDGKLQKAKLGAARLALTAKVRVLPVGLIGTYELFPKGKKFPKFKRKAVINIGKPIYLDEYFGKENNKKRLKEVTTLIMEEIAKLTNLKYNY